MEEKTLMKNKRFSSYQINDLRIVSSNSHEKTCLCYDVTMTGLKDASLSGVQRPPRFHTRAGSRLIITFQGKQKNPRKTKAKMSCNFMLRNKSLRW